MVIFTYHPCEAGRLSARLDSSCEKSAPFIGTPCPVNNEAGFSSANCRIDSPAFNQSIVKYAGGPFNSCF